MGVSKFSFVVLDFGAYINFFFFDNFEEAGLALVRFDLLIIFWV